MLTGKPDLSDVFQAKRECVINTFILKPWDDREIVATICALFALLVQAAPAAHVGSKPGSDRSWEVLVPRHR